MLTEAEAQALIERFYQGQNDGDWDAVGDCVTEDFEFEDMGFGLLLHGRKQLIDACIKARDGVFEGRTFGFEQIWATTGEGFVVRKNWRGTLRIDAFGSKAGTPVMMRACTLVSVRGRQMSRYIDYACYQWPSLGLFQTANDLWAQPA